jgi:outer membrane protein assembly factor BamD
LFDEVERQHPYSVWARRAQLMSAFSYYLAKDHTKSIDSARRFLAIHPGNKDAPYAHYLIALNYYEQIEDVTRDQSITRRRWIRWASSSAAIPHPLRRRRAAEGRPRARPPRRQGDGDRPLLPAPRQWLASVIRFRTVIDEYQTTSHTPEALMRLTESYLALGIPEEARKSAAVLGANYPNTKWYQRAYELVQRHGGALREPARPDSAGRFLTKASRRGGRGHADRPLHPRRRADRDAGPRIRPGLGVLTGETGAGKSILLDALGLALGARADSGLVRSRPGAGGGERQLRLPRRPPARALLADNGLDSEPGEPLVIRRIVKADGGSRAWSTTSPPPSPCFAISAPCWSRSTASMTIAASSTRAATAPARQLRPDRHAPCERAFRAWREAEAALAGARDELDVAERDREWLEHASPSSPSSRPSRARRRARLPARQHAEGRAARRGHRRVGPAARRLGRRPLAAPPGGAAARPDRGRA